MSSSIQKPDQISEAFFGLGLRPKLRRSADAHGRVAGERLVEPDLAGTHRSASSSRVVRSIASRVAASWMLPAPRLSTQIASLDFRTSISMQRSSCRFGLNMGTSVAIAKVVDDRLAGHSGNRHFIGRINVGDKHHIGLIKGAAEFFLKARVRE